jgi:putative phosphoesterase
VSKLAVITDVHADVHALRDALKQIDSLGCDRVVCCGDVVDYGLFPEETIALLRERKVMTIRGNHDRWAVKEGIDMSGWDLTPAAMHFLESLPTHRRSLIEGVRVVFEHARPESDMKGIAHDESEDELRRILKDAAADVLIIGHTHQPFVRRIGVGRVVINPGALLRDPAPGVEVLTPGTFAVVEIDRGVRVTIRRAATGEAVIAGR